MEAAEIPLGADDECDPSSSSGSEEGTCSLNALQLRAARQQLDSQGAAAGAGKATVAAVVASNLTEVEANGTSASTTPGCEGAWCDTIFAFNQGFDTMVPATMQQAINTYSEWTSDSQGIKIAVTQHAYYEMYHKNVESKLNQYLPQGYFNWDFTRLGTNYTIVRDTNDTVVVARPGTITFNLGWWMRSMFWNSAVQQLPEGQNFDFSKVTEFDDCTNCGAMLEYTLQKGGLSGTQPGWWITDLVVIKLG